MSGTVSPKQSDSSSSAASFIKVVQQLIQSDQEQIKANKMLELHGSFPVLRKINPSLSNQEKLTVFMRDANFRHRLCEKLAQAIGTEKIPIIKIRVYSVRYRSDIVQEFLESDLEKTFERFGRISSIFALKAQAFLQFESIISSYMAIEVLNQFQVVRDSLKLEVRWCKAEQQILAQHYFSTKFASMTSAFIENSKQEKYNCKYFIHLDCWPEFKLSQKIIGPKGNNMKKIFEYISSRHRIASVKQVQSSLKMKLRGKGSGCKQKSVKQSNQLLNFCISSKKKQLYDQACSQIQLILYKLASDYKLQFERMHLKKPQGLVYVKTENVGGNSIDKKALKLEEVQSLLSNEELSKLCKQKLPEKQVQLLVNKRNKARRAGRYRQADDIRQKLKILGVILVDGVGNNSNATTWKYIDTLK